MRLAANRLMLAFVKLSMFEIVADIETGFGKAIVDILKRNYPDQDVNISPSSLGHKLMMIARKQNQNNDQNAMDAIADTIEYFSVGSKYETDAEGKPVKDEEGKRVLRTKARPWDFAKDFDTWQKALSAIYSNIKRHSMSNSVYRTKKEQHERSVDDAFGTRGDGGGAPEGGESRIPSDQDAWIGKALDEKIATKQFLEVFEDYIPEFIASLPFEQKELFNLVYEDDVGNLIAGTDENMNQASAFKEKLEKLVDADRPLDPETGEIDEDAPVDSDAYRILKKNEKRWSGFVGDTRKKLKEALTDFVMDNMTPADRDILRAEHFKDTSPKTVRELERGKAQSGLDYQRGRDERKLANLKWVEKNMKMKPKDQTSLQSLTKRLKSEGVDVDAIEPVKPSPKSLKIYGGEPGTSGEAQESQIASRVSKIFTVANKLLSRY